MGARAAWFPFRERHGLLVREPGRVFARANIVLAFRAEGSLMVDGGAQEPLSFPCVTILALVDISYRSASAGSFSPEVAC